MARTNHTLLFSTTPHLLRRAMLYLTLALIVITGIVLTAPVQAFALQTSPSALSFTGTQGAIDPSAQSITVWKRGAREKSWTASASASWLIVSPMSGSLSTERDQISVGVNLSGLASGTYNAAVTVAATGSTTKTLPVTLTVIASTPATIGLNTTSLGFAGTVGGTNPSAQTFAISNTGGGTLIWNADDNAPWLTLSPLSGTNAGTITASVNLAGLLAGSYSATVTVTATGATTKTIPVTLTITASTSGGTIEFSPASLAFSGTVGGANPAAKPFTINNSAGGTLIWTISSNATWLRLNTSSGTTTTETDTISASVTTSGLAAGTYNAVLTVTASGSTNSPRSIPVSLTLNTTVAGSAGLTWNPNNETDLAGYKIYKATSSGAYGAPVTTLPKTTTSYTVTGLQTGTTYFFAITAYDNAGNESPPSGEVSKSIF